MGNLPPSPQIDIRTIKTIKLEDFGIFKNFQWGSLPEFNQFNLIYGWNRSGKTTLSRAIASCENKAMFPDYSSGKLKIKLSDGVEVNTGNIGQCDLPIKIFNSDFIRDNIFFDNGEKHCNPIVYIGEEDIESKKKLEELKLKQDAFQKDFEVKTTQKKAKEDAEENFRKTLAGEIKRTIGETTQRSRHYDYNKGHVKESLETIGVDNYGTKELTNDKFQEYKKLIGSEALKTQMAQGKFVLSCTIGSKQCSTFSDITDAINELLAKQAVSETIERLKTDQQINLWVKQGFDLHQSKSEKTKCLFCQNDFAADFWDSLSKHFSKDYEMLITDLSKAITAMQQIKLTKVPEQNKELYPEFQKRYIGTTKQINEIVEKAEKWLLEIVQKLQQKQNNLFAIIAPVNSIDDPAASYNDAIETLGKIIAEHNAKVSNHDQAAKDAKLAIEEHLIAEAIKSNDYGKIKKESDEVAESLKITTADKNNNFIEIQKLERQTSNTGIAIEKINQYLEQFFGQKEVQLEQEDSTGGYILKRQGQVAKNLSEGEKTAIAFSYFITKTKEKEFKIKEGIIFIDDPISSLDLNFIYHCFSMVKSHFNDVGQLFISTHNFEFFTLIKEWFCNKNSKSKPTAVCEFYMVDNEEDGDGRIANLKPLDETLKKFKSEYHYLFFLLDDFANTDVSDYKKFYVIGNIARRFAEIFTSFKVPTTGDLSSKLGQLASNVSEVEKDKVYKLINEFSHVPDPTRALQHNDKSESKEAVITLLKIVEESDKTHFDILKKEVSVCS